MYISNLFQFSRVTNYFNGIVVPESNYLHLLIHIEMIENRNLRLLNETIMVLSSHLCFLCGI